MIFNLGNNKFFFIQFYNEWPGFLNTYKDPYYFHFFDTYISRSPSEKTAQFHISICNFTLVIGTATLEGECSCASNGCSCDYVAK